MAVTSSKERSGEAETGRTYRDAPWEQYPDGYSKFAAFLTADPDKSTTIFRRFDRANARNLLVLESEIAELEARLDRIEMEGGGQDFLASEQSWEILNYQANMEKGKIGDEARAVVRITMELRAKLKEYYEAVLRTQNMMALSRPNERALKAIRRFFKRNRAMTDGAELIAGAMVKHLDKSNEEDLCVLGTSVEPDRLTRLFEGRFAFLFREKINDEPSAIILHRKVELAVSFISTVCAAIFLIGAILGLYFVTSSKARLGMLSGFTVAFAASLAVLTNARRQDVFAATAAYAAVLVVFVSGNLAASSTQSTQVNAQTSTATVTATITSVKTLISHTAANTSTSSTSASPTPGLSSGAKAGIGVGVSMGLLVIVGVLCYSFRMRRAAQKSRENWGEEGHVPPTPYIESL